jgi:Trypsin
MLSLLAAVPVAAAPDPIIGGTPATQGEFPNVVGIVLTTSSGVALCTGTLITDEWVMTAAHCVYPAEAGVGSQSDITSALRVYVNALTIFPAPSGNDGLTAQDSMYDPGFQGTSSEEIGMGHDIGLIHLSTPVEGVTPVKLNFDASSAQPGLAVTQVGYGETGVEAGATVGTLYDVGQTTTACESLVGVSDTMFLCFNQSNGKGKCEGDSGGPSFAQIGGQTFEVGVTSFGDPNCAMYGADTRTDFEKSFLTLVIPSLDTCSTDSDCGSGFECFDMACILDPYSPMGLGSSCGSGADCESGDCVTTNNDGSKCSMACTTGNDSTCPDGFQCIADGSNGACVPGGGGGGGCCDASGQGAPTGLLGIALVGMIWRRTRRRADRAT